MKKKLKILYSLKKKWASGQKGIWDDLRTICGRVINMCYDERRCLFMSPKISQYIAAITFIGILAFLPYAIIYAAVKIFEFFKEIKH